MEPFPGHKRPGIKVYMAFFIIVFLAIFSFYSCTNKVSRAETEFEAMFNGIFSPDEPGGSVLVKKGDRIIFLRSYGIADLRTGEKITENTIFNLGSISKTFVAYGILILQQEGRLSVEDSLSKYFNDFDNKDIAEKIKIKHFLSHTSGIPDLRRVEERKEFYLTAKDRENFEPLKHVEKLNFQPGEKFEYSNPAFNGLALIIEKVSGQKWQQFIKERIFAPAGMKNCRITDGSYPEKGVAHAYIKENGRFMEYDYGEFPTFAAAGNGGIWCSVMELVKYERAINDHVFLSKELIERSRSVFYPENWKDKNPPQLGWSWFILTRDNPENRFGVKIVYHTGSQGGFRSFYVSIPEKKILYIGLFNRPVDNLKDLRLKGLEILKKYNWLD